MPLVVLLVFVAVTVVVLERLPSAGSVPQAFRDWSEQAARDPDELATGWYASPVQLMLFVASAAMMGVAIAVSLGELLG